MGIEKAKLVLDKALQRCQIYGWQDWAVEEVEKLIKDTKEALNKGKLKIIKEVKK